MVLGTAPEGGGAALVAAVTPESGLNAADLLEEGKKLIKGGGGKDPLLAVAGGKDADGLDAALGERAGGGRHHRLVRALGLDLGSKRIGVALSTSDGSMATPYEVVERSGDRARDHRAIAELAADAGAERLVVGLPLSLDGSDGPAATAARAEAVELASVDRPAG